MIVKTIIYSILAFVIHTVSYGQNVSNLSGKWISEKDKSNIIEFKENKFYEYLDNNLEEEGTFFLSSKCNVKSAFLKQDKSIFLNQISSDNSIICSEISTLTKNMLTLMFSENGKISTFVRKKVKIKK